MIRKRFGIIITIIVSFIMLCYTASPCIEAYDVFNVPFLTHEEEDYISAHGTEELKIGYVQDRTPISFKNKSGEFDGVTRYVLDRVSELSGLKFRYEALPMGSVTYEYLMNEGFDLVTSVEYNEENKKANGILISNPYLSSRKVVVAKNDLEFDYTEKWSVAVATGSQTLKKALADLFPNFEIKDYETISDCFKAVNKGEADLMIQNQYVVEYWLAKPEYENLKVIPVEGLTDELCFSAVVEFGENSEKSQIEGQTLINILDKAISRITEDEAGNYVIKGVMENQYEYTFSDFIRRYRYSVSIFVILIVMIIVMVIILMKQRVVYAGSQAEAKAKRRFLSDMSHELRTPLNGLIGLNYLMLQKLDDKNTLKEYLNQSSVAARYLLTLVNDILDASMLQDENMKLTNKPVDLRLMIDTVSSVLQSSMNDKELKYTANTRFDHQYVMGDEVRISQIIMNLIDNAYKFTDKGGSIEINLEQKPDNDNKILTSISVSDTGKGMSEEFQEHIFDIFAQERETVSKGNQGTGLGLYVCRRLALLMGGDITCTSQKGVGSCFTFSFVSEAAENDGEKENEVNGIASGDVTNTRVLIAEDNELNAEIILELLSSGGLESDIAENGRIALEMFEASEPGTYGIIIMDLMMPEMNGFEATRAIRALDRSDAKTVRIIACTANSKSEEMDKALDSGMDDFINKPVDITELFKRF